MLNLIINSKSKTFLTGCMCMLLGIAALSIAEVEMTISMMIVIPFVWVALMILFQSHRKRRYVLIFVGCFVCGCFRYQLAFPSWSNHVSEYTNRQLEVHAIVSAEPDIRTDSIRYIVRATREYSGKLYMKQPLYPRYQYGDQLQLTCKIEKPEPIEEFRYDMYLARFGVFAICRNPKILEKTGEQGNIMLRSIYQLKTIVAERVNILWHEPHASFMAGLLYGYRGGLGRLNDLFSVTGTTHIIAISGYNITIISTILMTICMQLLIPRKKAFWVIVCGIAVFVIFAGLSASVVRAGIMGGLVLLATQMGRRSHILNVMILTAVIMTLHNPFILVWDAGFQLSFLSTLGLVYLSPIIEPWFRKVPEVLGLRESLVATLSATLSTLPLILSQFGRLSIVALPVNMLILWIIPFLMALGFFAVIISWILFPIGQIIAWIAWIGLQYIIVVVTWFAGFSFAAVDVTISAPLMLLAYGVGGVVVWRNRELRMENGECRIEDTELRMQN